MARTSPKSTDSFIKSLHGLPKDTILRELCSNEICSSLYILLLGIIHLLVWNMLSLFYFVNREVHFSDISYQYVEPPDGAYGAFDNGSWNGLIRMILQGVIYH